MKVLIGCECSARIRDAFRDLGHDAWSCDLKPCEGDSIYHIQDDVFRAVRSEEWDIGIFHPCCRYLSVSGARWKYEKPGWEMNQRLAIAFAEDIWALRSCFSVGMALENPVGILSTRSKLGKPAQYIQPWMFGDEFKKKTGLWLDRLPKLIPTSLSDGSNAVPECWLASPTKNPEDRRTKRARTYPGIARAMAEQWGKVAAEEAYQIMRMRKQ